MYSIKKLENAQITDLAKIRTNAYPGDPTSYSPTVHSSTVFTVLVSPLEIIISNVILILILIILSLLYNPLKWGINKLRK